MPFLNLLRPYEHFNMKMDYIHSNWWHFNLLNKEGLYFFTNINFASFLSSKAALKEDRSEMEQSG